MKTRPQCKSPIEIKGRTIGGDVPLICLPLVSKDRGDLLRQARQAVAFAPDMFEWRVDAFEHAGGLDHVLGALKALRAVIEPYPLLFTCRSREEGGMASLSEQMRLDLITSALATGHVDLVDIEISSGHDLLGAVLRAGREFDVKVMLSSHDFHTTPSEEDIVKTLIRAESSGADIAKIAVMPRCVMDVLTLFKATLQARTEHLQIPMVTMAMGDQGRITRLAGGLFGSDITFARGETASASGQMGIKELHHALTLLYPDASAKS
jgi:3-dehydroquinate dehydratase-1